MPTLRLERCNIPTHPDFRILTFSGIFDNSGHIRVVSFSFQKESAEKLLNSLTEYWWLFMRFYLGYIWLLAGVAKANEDFISQGFSNSIIYFSSGTNPLYRSFFNQYNIAQLNILRIYCGIRGTCNWNSYDAWTIHQDCSIFLRFLLTFNSS